MLTLGRPPSAAVRLHNRDSLDCKLIDGNECHRIAHRIWTGITGVTPAPKWAFIPRNQSIYGARGAYGRTGSDSHRLAKSFALSKPKVSAASSHAIWRQLVTTARAPQNKENKEGRDVTTRAGAKESANSSVQAPLTQGAPLPTTCPSGNKKPEKENKKR
jgi:hypothetical protein